MTEGDGPGPPDNPAVAGLTYTEASAELDEIVAFFEQRDVDVDQLVARLERATAIVDELDRRLRRTRAQVEELVPRLARAVATGEGSPDVGESGLSDGEDRHGEDDEVMDQAPEMAEPSGTPELF